MSQMRLRSAIMPDNNIQGVLTKAGSAAQDENMAIIVELMLDMRQIAAAQLVIANGGELPTPAWLEDIAKGI